MTLIFDWDGTLHDTSRLYGQAFRCVYRELVEAGWAPDKDYTDEELSVYIGMNARDMWDAFMPQLPQAVKKAASARIGRELTERIRQGEARLYDGVPTVLDELKRQGHTLLFLSNCKHAYQEAHREVFDLDRWFSGYFCCEDYNNLPKEEIFPFLAAQFPGPYLMIGDRASDLQVALHHGLPSIGCLYGFGAPGELDRASRLVRSCAEIPGCVQKCFLIAASIV